MAIFVFSRNRCVHWIAKYSFANMSSRLCWSLMSNLRKGIFEIWGEKMHALLFKSNKFSFNYNVDFIIDYFSFLLHKVWILFLIIDIHLLDWIWKPQKNSKTRLLLLKRSCLPPALTFLSIIVKIWLLLIFWIWTGKKLHQICFKFIKQFRLLFIKWFL